MRPIWQSFLVVVVASLSSLPLLMSLVGRFSTVKMLHASAQDLHTSSKELVFLSESNAWAISIDGCSTSETVDSWVHGILV